MAAQMGGEYGGEWIHVYVWLSPVATGIANYSPETITALLVGYTPIQDKKF